MIADFYTMALFDCDAGTYGTYTDYDMPPRNAATPKLSATADHLDIRYASSAGTGTWTTCRDDDGHLLPYTYRVDVVGVDQAGRSMGLSWRSRRPASRFRSAQPVRRPDRLLRPGRHVFVFPDPDGDDRDAALGRRP